jgi:hypothetical protein
MLIALPAALVFLLMSFALPETRGRRLAARGPDVAANQLRASSNPTLLKNGQRH